MPFLAPPPSTINTTHASVHIFSDATRRQLDRGIALSMRVIELDIINYQKNDEKMDISIQLGEATDRQQKHQSKPKTHNNQRANIAVIATE